VQVRCLQNKRNTPKMWVAADAMFRLSSVTFNKAQNAIRASVTMPIAYKPLPRALPYLRCGAYVLCTALLFTACATTAPPPAPVAAPAVQSLAQYMQEAGKASTEGSKLRSRELYYAAAKTYPASKEPWLKLAEDYFEASNYGQAILAAQEVIQRDPDDSLATGVLAVSGLRVSASALSTLRKQQSSLNGGTRTEAESLARLLRDLLGEPVLVPRPSAGSAAAPAAAPIAPAAKPKPRVLRIGGSAADATAAPSPSAPPAATPAPPAQKSQTPDNPFNVLKK
jgi:tetratricopeptide (TPR) repeat protein